MRQFNKYILYIILSILITFAWVALPVSIIVAQEQESSQSYEEELEQKANSQADNAAGDVGNFSQNSIDKIRSGTASINSGTGRRVATSMLRSVYQIYIMLKATAKYIITVSIFIGVLLMVICRKNKRRRRTGLYFFIIAIPVFVFALVYGIGILNGIYLDMAGETYATTPRYDAMVNRYAGYSPAGGSWFVTALNAFHIAYGGILAMTPVIILIFVSLGLLRVFFCKYDSKKRDVGLYGYCIGAPAALVLVSVGAEIIGRVFI